MGTFYFIRHGQSEANAEHKIGGPDSPLTELGITQAKQAIQEIKQLDITKIFHSPYIRARQTAQIIGTGIDLTDGLVEVNDLRERGFGNLEDKPKEHDSTWYFTVDDVSLGIESRDQVIDRMKNVIDQIRQQVNEGEAVLIVGHATSGYYLEQVAAGKTKFEDFGPPVEFENAKIIKIAFN